MGGIKEQTRDGSMKAKYQQHISIIKYITAMVKWMAVFGDEVVVAVVGNLSCFDICSMKHVGS